MSEAESNIPRDWLKNTSPSDFDGHTGFESWTAEQRLAWLSEAAEFAYEVRVRREGAGRSLLAHASGDDRSDQSKPRSSRGIPDSP